MTKEKLISLITKYAVILIVFDIINRFLLPYGATAFYNLFPDWSADPPSFAIVMTAMSVMLNLALALIIVADMDTKGLLMIALFVLTLFAPWTAIMFLIITKVIELRSPDLTGGKPESVGDQS